MTSNPLYTLSSLPKLPGRGLYTAAAQAARVGFLESELGVSIPQTSESRIPPESLKKNIENFIGTIEIPVGVAGPLLFDGQCATGLIYAPFATTEGALVATITKGAQALSRSGGIRTRVLAQRMVRTPVFDFPSITACATFISWIENHFDEISDITRQYSSYAKLKQISPFILGRSVYLEFEYTTGDASGQNMTTTCTWHAVLWIKTHIADSLGLTNLMIEATASSDKRASVYNLLKGRGCRVFAEATLSDEVVQTVLGSDSDRLVKAFHRCMMGSAQLGVVGTNINVANVIAALFTATGQDIACVHESSVSQLHLERVEGGVYVSLVLPSLVVATVGGGTHLYHQKGYLKLLGCDGPGHVQRYAEIVAGFCVALDICTLSALESGRFAIAHEKLGRNRPVKWMTQSDLTPELYTKMLKNAGHATATVLEIEAQSVTLGSSIISELTARKVTKIVGLFPQRLTIAVDGGVETIAVITKIKSLDKEVTLMVSALASACQSELGQVYPHFAAQTGMACCDIKELALYQQKDPRFTSHSPQLWGLLHDDAREARILILENVANARLKDTADDPSEWNDTDIQLVAHGLAQLHAIWINQTEPLSEKPWIGHQTTARSLFDMKPLFLALTNNARAEHGWFSEADYQLRKTLIDTLSEWATAIEDLPKTLIHNDFNPRNLCIRVDKDGDRLCVYDWELAAIHLPQYDWIEFLCFVLHPTDITPASLRQHLSTFRETLAIASKVQWTDVDWYRGFRAGFNEFVLLRVGMYLMAHSQRDYGFMRRLNDSVHAIHHALANIERTL